MELGRPALATHLVIAAIPSARTRLAPLRGIRDKLDPLAPRPPEQPHHLKGGTGAYCDMSVST